MNNQLQAPHNFFTLILDLLANIEQFYVFSLNYKPLCLLSSLVFKGKL
jgi:hypothetical protein